MESLELRCFLRQREVVHFQRFGEALNKLQADMQEKKFFAGGIKKDCCCDNKKD